MPDFSAAQWIVLIGTICTGIGTIITAYAAIVRAKKETHSEAEIACLERLKAARLDESILRDEIRELERKYQA